MAHLNGLDVVKLDLRHPHQAVFNTAGHQQAGHVEVSVTLIPAQPSCTAVPARNAPLQLSSWE